MSGKAPRYYKPIPPVRAELSDITRQGLKAWLDWVEADCPGHPVFTRSTGLCANLHWWAYRAHGHETMGVVIDDLELAFDERRYPFGGDIRYGWEQRNFAMHENKHRLAWVRANLPIEEEHQS